MKLATFEDFANFANFFYNTIGVEPYHKKETSRLKTVVITSIFYLSFIILFFDLPAKFGYVILALVNGDHFIEATLTMAYIGFVLVGFFKMLFVHSRKDDLTTLVSGLQQIFPKTPELQAEYNTHHYLKQCSRINKSFTWLYMIAIWTYNLYNLAQYFVYDYWLNIREIGKTLPYFMYIPWNYENNWTYYMIYALQNIAGYAAAAGHISGDLLITACATQLIMHYDFTSRKISDYQVKKGQKRLSANEGYTLDLEFLKNIIQYHNNLLDLSDQLNSVFGIALLFNFVTSCFIICFVGFLITVGATIETILKLLLFLTTSTVQVYLICYHGQNLMDASTNVAEAVYNQSWTNADLRYMKMLVLIAQRAQKPALLKATSFVSVTRGTMTELMQISYKFYALLRTIYAE